MPTPEKSHSQAAEGPDEAQEAGDQAAEGATSGQTATAGAKSQAEGDR
jgi:hypothetical protein